MLKYWKCSVCNCTLEEIDSGYCVKTYYIINRKAVCKDCAKKVKGRCPICGDIKGWCNHQQEGENGIN